MSKNGHEINLKSKQKQTILFYLYMKFYNMELWRDHI